MNDPSPLDRVRIASPCTADWNAMEGDDRRRFCSQCRLHVYDVGRMTTDEALALLRQVGQGRVCARLHRRADGTVLTRDCPVGLRRRLRRAFARAAALWLCLWGGLAACVRPRGDAAAPTPTGRTATPPDDDVLLGEFVVPDGPDGTEMGDVEVRAVPAPTMGRVRVEPR